MHGEIGINRCAPAGKAAGDAEVSEKIFELRAPVGRKRYLDTGPTVQPVRHRSDDSLSPELRCPADRVPHLRPRELVVGPCEPACSIDQPIVE